MLKIAVCDDEQSYLHDVKHLLDVYMPGMTGIELAGQLRRIGIEAPVVFPAPIPRPTSPQKASTQVIPMASSAGMAA